MPIPERTHGSLTDQALARITTCAPALMPAQAEDLVGALAKLFDQYVREDRCRAWRVAVECDGAALVLAWDGAALSGCSHDKVAQVLAVHETRTGAALLAAPPLLIDLAGTPTAVDRPALRRLLADGRVDGRTGLWNVRAATLGEWQAGTTALADSPMATLLSTKPV